MIAELLISFTNHSPAIGIFQFFKFPYAFTFPIIPIFRFLFRSNIDWNGWTHYIIEQFKWSL